MDRCRLVGKLPSSWTYTEPFGLRDESALVLEPAELEGVPRVIALDGHWGCLQSALIEILDSPKPAVWQMACCSRL